MSDWAVGDLAVCVESGRQTRAGQSYIVRDIKLPGECRDGTTNRTGVVLLRFVGLIPEFRGDWSGAPRFRKILPDKHEACESEFVTLLRRIKRKVSA